MREPRALKTFQQLRSPDCGSRARSNMVGSRKTVLTVKDSTLVNWLGVNWLGVIWLGTFLALFGCGKGTSGRYEVSGQVTLEGAPLETGLVRFVPVGGTKSPSVGGEIKQGAFEISADDGPFAGDYRVEITASRGTGVTRYDKVLDINYEEQEQYLPARYNSSTELTAQVTAEETNEFNFDLSLDGNKR